MREGNATRSTLGVPLTPGASSSVVVCFPMRNRIGKIRDVARKLLAAKSSRHAMNYRQQVTDGLARSLKHVPSERHQRHLADFWIAVDLEVSRLLAAQPTGPRR